MNYVHIDRVHRQSSCTLSTLTEFMRSVDVDRAHEFCPNGQTATSFCLELNSAIASYTLFCYNMSFIMVIIYIANKCTYNVPCSQYKINLNFYPTTPRLAL